MIVSFSSTAARGALVGVAVAVAAYLTYFSVREARATYYSETQTLFGYERATQLEPENARNWYLLGRYLQYSLEEPNPQRAISSYLTSLHLDPRATVTWLDLAATYESEGNDAAARNAFSNAKKTYPLSAEVSWRYGNFLLRQGELELAFSEIRRSVEADPNRAAEAFSRCVRVEPNADVILDRVLPAKRDVYVAVMQDLTGDRQIENALKVWKRLAAMHPKISLTDVALLVLVLRQMDQAEEAHSVWEQAAGFAGLADLEGPKGSAVWDGGFESDVMGQGYAWRFSNNSHGVQIGFDSQEKHSGKRSLRVSFDGNSDIDFRDVCQTVPVEGATSYELSGWMQTKVLTTDEGVRLELRPRTPGAAPVTTSDVHGTQPWTRVATTWEAAKDSQEVEICLRRDASDQEDNKIRGTVWVDDAALTPVAKSSANP
jgi:tetratricopeptide (TPR) repeat protein